MNWQKCSQIYEELRSSEVEALCFLCLDVLKQKELEEIEHARDLFQKLKERGLMDNDNFILQLLQTIERLDLVRLLKPDSQQAVETDAVPLLSKYRVMLYKISEDMTTDNLDKLKLLLCDKLKRREMEKCNTALDVFSKMESAELFSQTNVDGLHQYLLLVGQKLASLVKNYKEMYSHLERFNSADPVPVAPSSIEHQATYHAGVRQTDHQELGGPCTYSTPCLEPAVNQELEMLSWDDDDDDDDGSLRLQSRDGLKSISHASMDNQNANNCSPPHDVSLSIPKTQESFGGLSISSAQPSTKSSSPRIETAFYHLDNFPRGLCVIISNENFECPQLKRRRGTKEDEKTIEALFTKFGFTVELCTDLTANEMQEKVKELGKKDFTDEDALVVFVLSHGESGHVFGTDEEEVLLEDLKLPFTSLQAPTLAGKPKLFFIQACRGKNYQKGGVPHPLKPAQNEVKDQFEEDSGPIHVKTIPEKADFLQGMATVEDCKSYRGVITGSIYIQALCKMLRESAESPAPDDVLSILTRVNKEVSEFEHQGNKQMSELTHTLTKKLVLTFFKEKKK